MDILQPDITWVGGLTEAKKIYSMAAAYDIPVIPHGSSVFSYHLQFASPNSPMAEILIMSPKADKVDHQMTPIVVVCMHSQPKGCFLSPLIAVQVVPVFGNLFKDEPLPENGFISLDENKAGWGVELNKELKLSRPYPQRSK